MSPWLPLSLIICNRVFETNVYSVDEVVVRKREVILIRNRLNFTRLAFISFEFTNKFLPVALYRGSENFP